VGGQTATATHILDFDVDEGFTWFQVFVAYHIPFFFTKIIKVSYLPASVAQSGQPQMVLM
jgi:hypothetical protein